MNRFFLIVFFFLTLSISAQDWQIFTDSIATLSSPRSTDLNGDGVMDIVIGGGTDSVFSNNSIMAYNGVDGTLLWKTSSRNEVFGSAIFQDVTGDGISDVIIAGREAQLLAIDGFNGLVLWDYPLVNPSDSGRLNFYNPQFIHDVDGDTYADILVTNGGDHSAPSWQTNRPPGHLMVISSLTGNLIIKAVVPDSSETYCSPIVHDIKNTGNQWILYGTGGEHLGGNFYAVLLDDLLLGDLSGSVVLASDLNKGFIAPAAIHKTNSGVYDIIIQSFDGLVTKISGQTFSSIWTYQRPGTESSAQPVIGNFTGDLTPDVLLVLFKGIAPSYNDYYQVMLDGNDGSVRFLDSLGSIHFASANAVDLNNDGRDEGVYSINYLDNGYFKNRIHSIDFTTNIINTLDQTRTGVNIASTPLITDLDSDGQLDLVYSVKRDSLDPMGWKGIYVYRHELISTIPNSGIAWGSYLGTNMDGIYNSDLINCGNGSLISSINKVHPSCNGFSDGTISLSLVGNSSFYTYLWSNQSTNLSIQNLEAGSYWIQVTDSTGCYELRTINLFNPFTISFGGIAPPTCVGDSNGTATLSSSGCPCMFNSCTYLWENAVTTKTNTSLPIGWNSVMITHTNGCVVIDSVLIDSDTAYTNITACDSLVWYGNTYTQSGLYYFNNVLNQNLLDTLNVRFTYIGNYNGHYYYISNSYEDLNYVRQIFNPIGGYLSSISDLSENNWIWNQLWNNFGMNISEDVFIGFTDENIEGQWEWINGELVSFSNFGVSEGPNNSINPLLENFSTINYGGNSNGVYGFWSDVPGDSRFALIEFNTNPRAICDSVVVLNLTINYSNTGSTSVTACDSYTWDGVAYTASGAYTNVYTNVSGCDSVHTLNLTINNSTTSTSTHTACDSYSWNGTAYTASGSYTYSTANANGCDSTATLNLTINYSNTGSGTVTACDSYSWDGVVYDTTGTYTNTYTNVAGCDSVHILNLTINYSSSSSLHITTCDSYTWGINGLTYTDVGIYVDTSTNVNGCVHIDSLILNILTSSTSLSIDTACDSYSWNGILYDTTGTYTYTTLNAVGCDSIATLDLIVNYSNSSGASPTTIACDSFVWHGITYTSSGTYNWIGSNIHGCDSIAYLNLIVNNSSNINIYDTICEGDTLFVGNSYYTSAGVYTDTLNTANGCDSIVDTYLSTYPNTQASAIIGPDSVYVNTTHTYDVDPATPTSIYHWGIYGNALIVGGQGTMQIEVEWDSLYTQTLFVIETTADSCIGDTIFIKIYVEAEPSNIYENQISDVMIYPNPSRGVVTISFSSNIINDYQVMIRNIIGEIVFEEKLNNFKGEYKTTLDLSEYSKAIYFLELDTGNGVINKKLILQ